MDLTILEPKGPRPGLKPETGIETADQLIGCLLYTLGIEAALGAKRVVLDIDMSGIDESKLASCIAQVLGEHFEARH